MALQKQGKGFRAQQTELGCQDGQDREKTVRGLQ
jgi:hypothetical protein